MGRPSKLSEAQWDEILRRNTAGESASALAKEFNLSKAAVSKRIAKPATYIKDVVNQVLTAEVALKSMPPAHRLVATDLIDELRQLSMSTVQVATLGMRTAHRLAAIANEQAQKIDDADPMADASAVKSVGVLGEMVKTHASVGLNLLAANKEAFRSGDGEKSVPQFLIEGGLPD